MPDLAAAARRLERAAAQLQAEQARDGGPRASEIRHITDRVRDIATDLTTMAYDPDLGRA